MSEISQIGLLATIAIAMAALSWPSGSADAQEAAVEAPKVKISKRDCRRLVKHVARADVEYKPGVDVRGKKVVPADLGGAPRIKLPSELTIDIGIDLGKRLGIGDDGDKFSSQTSIGKVKYNINSGRLTFNGQPIGNSEQTELAEKCRAIVAKGR